MQETPVGGNEEAASSNTAWAYVPCGYDTSDRPKPDSPTLLSTLCCCFSEDVERYAEIKTPVHFPAGDDPPVTLSQALLCVDNPRVDNSGSFFFLLILNIFTLVVLRRVFQVPSDLVSYPITEEIILAEHRSHNVLMVPRVFKSTQLMYMGYDVQSSSESQH